MVLDSIVFKNFYGVDLFCFCSFCHEWHCA